MGASSAGNDITFRLDGVFDVRVARRLERMIEEAPAGATVRVDLSKVRDFDDFGVAVLAQTLKHLQGVSVRLQGLRTHQARLMRYFGVDARRFAAAPKRPGVPDADADAA